MSKLEPKQLKFCHEYVRDINATQAAIRAGYSKKTAEQQGARLLVNVKVKEKIAELNKKAVIRCEIDGDEVKKKIKVITDSNIRDLVNDDLTFKKISELTPEMTYAIESIEVIETTKGRGEDKYTEKRVRFRLHDKTKALDMLGRVAGIYEQDNDQKKNATVQIIDYTSLTDKQLTIIATLPIKSEG